MFKLHSEYKPTGDQPQAIEYLSKGIKEGKKFQTLLGVTGSGKTFTMANIIEKVQKPTLVLAHNKTLAGQLYSEFKEFFPENAVEYFVSYYDYYQPEAYIPQSDTYIEKDASINDEIDKLRHSATLSLFETRDVIIIASVSCIYGLGDPVDYNEMMLSLRPQMTKSRNNIMKKLINMQYSRNELDFKRGTFRAKGDVLEIYPSSESESAVRVEFWGDEIEKINEINPLTGKVIGFRNHILIPPASQYVTNKDKLEKAIVTIEEEMNAQVEYFKSQETIDIAADAKSVRLDIYVEDAENMAPIIKSGSEDNRKVTKIIEVVPHQICSAFPYMVDWGTAEDYNENLMVGYEGMRYIMFANLDGHIGGSKDRITRDGSPEKLYELFGYDTVEFHNAYGDSPYTGEWQSKYWRIYESDNNVMNVNGYFEYVGAGKGLYDIDTGTVVEKEDAAHYGIRYEMTAMDRKGSENPKGEYTVKDPVCYVAKDYMPAYNPDTSKIKQWTGYHYLLKFDCKSATSADYRIYHVAGKSTTNASLAYEYQAYLAEGVSWDNGYEYQSGGNYKPDQITAKSARDLGEANYAGKYLRVESSKNKDGAAGVKNGYFKLYDAVTDRTSITDDTVLYDVTFQEAVSGGSYVLSAAGGKKVIQPDTV